MFAPPPLQRDHALSPAMACGPGMVHQRSAPACPPTCQSPDCDLYVPSTVAGMINPCQNGGYVLNYGGDYFCVCTDGFAGNHCEKCGYQ